jgi:ribulose 1,5-bisphosphate synthetase/thiazole synthase
VLDNIILPSTLCNGILELTIHKNLVGIISKKIMKQGELMRRLLGDGEEGGYDAVVVGSGYGGFVAACRMSMAGIKVCLIEKG